MNAKKKKLKPTLYYEKKCKKRGFRLVIGVDEAGRGPLAGPVVAAAVALKTPNFNNYIDDSKKLNSRLREKAYLEIIEKSVFGIGIINEKVIDQLNILVATRIAMENAVIELLDKIKTYRKKNIHILIDGNVKLDTDLAVTNIIKGDCRCISIACASILAKVTRDRIMSLYHKIYPQYEFQKHKGYPTRRHRLALKKFGPSIIHRMSFYGV